MQKTSVYVNGYGATTRLDDRNYREYLGLISRELRVQPRQRFEVFLCGGHTNRLDLTEAECMHRIWSALGVPSNVVLYKIEHTTSATENLRAFRDCVGDTRPLIFCEHSRARTVYALARVFFDAYEVIGVPFDEYSMTLRHRLRQTLISLPFTLLARRFKAFAVLDQMVRQYRIARARVAERARD